jgi:hypothetical protein
LKATNRALDRAQGRLDPGPLQCLEDGVEHDPLAPRAADRLAALGAVELVATTHAGLGTSVLAL